MINFDEYTNENKIEHNSKWPYIPDHPYRMLIVDGSSGSGKTLCQGTLCRWWVRLPLQSLNLQIWRLLQARSSLTFRQL